MANPILDIISLLSLLYNPNYADIIINHIIQILRFPNFTMNVLFGQYTQHKLY